MNLRRRAGSHGPTSGPPETRQHVIASIDTEHRRSTDRRVSQHTPSQACVQHTILGETDVARLGCLATCLSRSGNEDVTRKLRRPLENRFIDTRQHDSIDAAYDLRVGITHEVDGEKL
jgi:hypothetical protein